MRDTAQVSQLLLAGIVACQLWTIRAPGTIQKTSMFFSTQRKKTQETADEERAECGALIPENQRNN